MKQTILDDMAAHISTGLKQACGLKEEADAQLKALLEQALSQFDVVTAERMQVQEALLAHARQQIELLEARLADLEERLNGQS